MSRECACDWGLSIFIFGDIHSAMAKPVKSKTAQNENAAAAARVLAFFVEKNGREHGAVKLLADELGADRKAVGEFIKRAIPRKYVEPISKITGWPAKDILPNP